jgi:hypothetical protein
LEEDMAINATTIEKAILLLNLTMYVLVAAIGCILINDAIDSGDDIGRHT